MTQDHNFWKICLLCLALLYLAVGQVAAWQARGNFHDDAHPGKCKISDDLIISPGEKVKSPTDCSEITCEGDNGDAVITGCGAVAAPPECEWGDYINKHAPFAECCARYLNCAGGLNNQTREMLQNIWSMFSPNLDLNKILGEQLMEKQ